MHWFLDPITKHYVDFGGRASRQEYWMFTLMFTVVMIIGTALLVLIDSTFILAGIILLVFMAATVLPQLAIQVRRLHDIGRSGWWILLSFLPYIGGLVLLIMYCLPSEVGHNKYGANPYGLSGMPVVPEVPTTPTPTV